MRNYGPCLCGDPECGACFPGSARLNRMARLRDEQLEREGRLCDHCGEEILEGQVKHAYGLNLHQACMFEEMAQKRRERLAAARKEKP